jgi:pimeloyl-ACP methyl ester carboxylesterase
MPSPRLFLITGFALDASAFSLLHLPPNRVRCLDLIPMEPGDTLAIYASRLIRQTDYQATDILGGVSLGGMLALEAARQHGTRALALIASATEPQFIRTVFRALSYVAPEAPEEFLRLVFGGVPKTLHRLGMMSDANRDMLAKVMAAFPIALLQRLPPMILAWPGCQPVAPLHRLHSSGDWMIRFDGRGQCDGLLPGRHHLLTVSHPRLCRDFLMGILAKYENKTSL